MPPPPHPSAAHEIRLRCRRGTLASPTASLASGHIQANLLVLPSAYAPDFRDLCARNPVPCPLLASSDIVGDATSIDDKTLIKVDGGGDFDLRTDLPMYNVYRDGKLVERKTDVVDEWERDHVAFLVGCSFSFEGALESAGLRPRHWDVGCNVAMYRTKMRLVPAGKFTSGHWVVSMRPYKLEDVERVRDVTRPFRGMHGEPVAWGWDALEELGIVNLGKPEFGDVIEVREDEVPVFWGCGVTPQMAAIAAGIPGTVIAHAPGHMLVLDKRDEDVLGEKQVVDFKMAEEPGEVTSTGVAV